MKKTPQKPATKKPAPKKTVVQKVKFATVKHIEKLNKKIDTLQTQLAKSKAQSAVKVQKQTAPRKLSPYNKFVKAGLKAGKSMADIAAEWKKKNA